jgi:signal transduction histidine kinase
MTKRFSTTRLQSWWTGLDPGAGAALAWIGVGLVVVTLLHYTTVPGLRELHTVYRYFYFLPIVYAAVRFGFWGGIGASLLASLVFAPHIFFKWGHFPEDSLNDLLVVIVFCGVALITGVTVDRLRQSQRQQEATARQLADSLRQLEVQGEELRRAEHLSALGTLAGGLAHEIRNPVGIIRATAQLIEIECGDTATETVAIIGQETERIERFIQDLLNYAGETDLHRLATDAPALLRRVANRLRPLLETRGVALHIDAAADLPSLGVDAEQVEQALMNLCINAVQALGGAGHIRLSAARTADNAIAIAVADNGPGIAAADRVRIFAPFYTTKDSGTGMGLSVVQRIVENHGGRIAVASTPGQGATFTIYLPLCNDTVKG